MIPFSCTPIYQQRIWGGRNLTDLLGRTLPAGVIGESWEISDIADDVSVIDDGPDAGRSLRAVIEESPGSILGTGASASDRFPLLIKYLDAQDLLSVQVHPRDQYATEHENGSPGKTEMWIVLHAEPDAEMIAGLKSRVTRESFEDALRDGRIADCLRTHRVSVGDVLLMSAGRVHALGAGLIVLEIQQTSSITYRLHDWDRMDADGNPRDLHIDRALDVIDFDDTADPVLKPIVREEEWGKRSLLAATPYFVTERLEMDRAGEFATHASSPDVLVVLDGNARLTYHDGETNISRGMTVTVPASTGGYGLRPDGRCDIVVSSVPGEDPMPRWVSEANGVDRVIPVCDGLMALELKHLYGTT